MLHFRLCSVSPMYLWLNWFLLSTRFLFTCNYIHFIMLIISFPNKFIEYCLFFFFDNIFSHFLNLNAVGFWFSFVLRAYQRCICSLCWSSSCRGLRTAQGRRLSGRDQVRPLHASDFSGARWSTGAGDWKNPQIQVSLIAWAW